KLLKLHIHADRKIRFRRREMILVTGGWRFDNVCIVLFVKDIVHVQEELERVALVGQTTVHDKVRLDRWRGVKRIVNGIALPYISPDKRGVKVVEKSHTSPQICLLFRHHRNEVIVLRTAIEGGILVGIAAEQFE